MKVSCTGHLEVSSLLGYWFTLDFWKEFCVVGGEFNLNPVAIMELARGGDFWRNLHWPYCDLLLVVSTFYLLVEIFDLRYDNDLFISCSGLVTQG